MTDEQWRIYDERRGWVAYDDTPPDRRRRILGYGLASVLATLLCGVAWLGAVMASAFSAALSGDEPRIGLGSVLLFGALPLLLAGVSVGTALRARGLGAWTRLGRSLPAAVTVAAVTYAAVLMDTA